MVMIPRTSPTSTGSSGSPQDALTADQREMLAEIGVADTEDLLGAGPLPVAPASARNTLFVRSAQGGGSFWLNIASRVTGVLAVVVAVLVVGGGIYVGRSVLQGAASGARRLLHRGTGASRAALQVPGVLACGDAAGIKRLAAGEQMPGVLLGTRRLPRDKPSLVSVGAVSLVDNGDRIDIFRLGEATLSARYAGSTPVVRALLLTFATPQPACVALATAGLLVQDKDVRILPNGRVVPVRDSAALLAGMPQVWITGTPQATTAVQVSASP